MYPKIYKKEKTKKRILHKIAETLGITWRRRVGIEPTWTGVTHPHRI